MNVYPRPLEMDSCNHLLHSTATMDAEGITIDNKANIQLSSLALTPRGSLRALNTFRRNVTLSEVTLLAQISCRGLPNTRRVLTLCSKVTLVFNTILCP